MGAGGEGRRYMEGRGSERGGNKGEGRDKAEGRGGEGVRRPRGLRGIKREGATKREATYLLALVVEKQFLP